MSKPILFDVDGVIAKFTHSACRVHGKPEADGLNGGWDFFSQWGMDAKTFYAPMGRDFWANLGVWDDGMALLRFAETLVGEDNVILCTSPCETEGCKEGKRDWVKKHLPHKLRGLTICGVKHQLASPRHILVDDSDSNVERFREHGWALLVPRSWNKNAGWSDPRDGTFNPLVVAKSLEILLSRKD